MVNRDIPILFSAPMVKAILSGTKTQTRRIVTAPPSVKRFGREAHFDRAWVDQGPSPAGNPGPYLKLPVTGVRPSREVVERVYPRWFPGDRLWVKETWRPESVLVDDKEVRLSFRADGGHSVGWYTDWKIPEAAARGWVSPLLMPRWASRITLEITSVRVERLQSITEEDARAEGVSAVWSVPWLGEGCDQPSNSGDITSAVEAFSELWDDINGKKPGCSWDDNPWVWRVEFKRVGRLNG